MADVEAVVAPWIEGTFDVMAGAETPADLEARLPFVRVERIGGADARFAGHPRIAVDVFAGSADEARTLSSSVRDALLFLRGPVGEAVIRDVRCDAGPSRQPWANPAVYRRGAAYTVSLRAA
ncbi:hypothetical protein OTB20_08355 [Streptomyces sp. H27-H1]|uniref:hypothetical protein n=1 Tax=Streptomyces sp. H27-H1 TaxID=2996461 RepID=UPI002270AB91|nr:hypothetical protein [Streptomyces sp. H27-H1]MCY0926216.1 hypothetical protein [Streptomyces sp. H27-H1]